VAAAASARAPARGARAPAPVLEAGGEPVIPGEASERDLLRMQAAWLAPARARLLRRAGIAHRRRILDLGAGPGAVTEELVRRTEIPRPPGSRESPQDEAALIVALDRSLEALQADPEAFRGASRVCADAARLPFAAASFDLVFSQCALMWMELPAVLREVRRVLQREGVLIAIEPDYGGMIEYPDSIATRDLWIAALVRAGADPFAGRKLPWLLQSLGFETRIELLPEVHPPSPERFQLLGTLPLTPEECHQIDQIQRARLGFPPVVHLPFFLVTATLRSRE